MLASLEGDKVCYLLDLVERGADDRAWIAALAQQSGGGAVISGDGRMLTCNHELQALKDRRVTSFILAAGWSCLAFWDKAALLVARWPVIAAAAKNSAAGSIFLVHRRRGGLSQVP